ncbi:MAG TPA: hypothetical protein VF054_05045 [Micromonosporaceae bacterium]
MLRITALYNGKSRVGTHLPQNLRTLCTSSQALTLSWRVFRFNLTATPDDLSPGHLDDAVALGVHFRSPANPVSVDQQGDRP